MNDNRLVPRRRWRKLAVGGLIAGLASTGVMTAAAVETDDDAPELTTWAVPPLKTNTPQTEEEKKLSQQEGRALPVPEILQPTLDGALPSYQPLVKKNDLAGEYNCGSSDVLIGLAKTWTSEFSKMYPKVKFNFNPPYAGSLGTLEMIGGKYDCVFVSRELKPTDIQGFRDAYGYDPTSVPISGGTYRHFGFLDSMSFMVHKDNPIDKLSFDQLDAILSTTRHRGGEAITTWGDLGLTGDWADQPIQIHGIKPWNGFEEFVRQRVLSTPGERGEWRSPDQDPNVHWEEKVFDLAKGVADDKYALGYTGNAYVDAPVKLISVSDHNGDPAYAPTYENVASAKYPLSRLTYFNFNHDPQTPIDPAMKEFLRFVLSKQGQQQVLDQAVFLPLRAAQADSSASLLD